MLAPASSLRSQISNAPPGASYVPRFVVTLDASLAGEKSLVRVPLAITGKWVRGASEFSISLADLEEIVRNFNARDNREINVDYDHASEMPEVAAGGPVPSAGRIVGLDPPEALTPGPSPAAATRGEQGMRGQSSILWGWYEPTERARQLIKNREYRYISPAIDWAARSKRTGKPQGTTLTTVALTNRPFLEEMPQIRLSDPAFQPVDEPANARGPIENPKSKIGNSGGPMKHVTLSVADGKIKITHEDFKDDYVVEPEEMKKCLEELGLLSDATVASAIRTLAERPGAALSECVAEIGQRLATRQVITLDQATALLSEAEARGKWIPAADFFRAAVERELEEAVKAGRVLPRQRDDWRRIALSDFPTFRKVLAAQKPLVPLRPVGFSGPGPEGVQAQVKILAEQRMRERNVSFGQALSEIGREQPELVQQYRRAVSGE